MGGTAEAIGIVLSLLQLARETTVIAIEVTGVIEKARAENREVTDDEIAVARGQLSAARDRLVSGA